MKLVVSGNIVAKLHNILERWIKDTWFQVTRLILHWILGHLRYQRIIQNKQKTDGEFIAILKQQISRLQ